MMKLFFASLVMLALLVVSAVPVTAQVNVFPECQGPAANTAICKDPNNAPNRLVGGGDSLLARITQLIIYVVGAISVLMIVLGGLRYVLSNGDPQAANTARNTILYAVIGAVVAVTAQALLFFVVNRVVK